MPEDQINTNNKATNFRKTDILVLPPFFFVIEYRKIYEL